MRLAFKGSKQVWNETKEEAGRSTTKIGRYTEATGEQDGGCHTGADRNTTQCG